MMSVVGGLTAANLYYNQPLLEEMRASLGIGEKEANLITVITQIGYALGLLFVVPMFGIAAVIMLGSLLVTLRMMPVMLSSFSGTYRALIATVGKIYMSHRNMRLYSLRAAFSFGRCRGCKWCRQVHSPIIIGDSSRPL